MKDKFHVIEGKKAPDTSKEKSRKRVRRAPKIQGMLQCHRCNGREVIETKIGVVIKDGKPIGGTKQYLCVTCLLNGERVVIH